MKSEGIMGKRLLIFGIALALGVVSALALSSRAFAVWPFGDKKVNCCTKKMLRKAQCAEMSKEECEKAGGQVVKKCEDCK